MNLPKTIVLFVATLLVFLISQQSSAQSGSRGRSRQANGGGATGATTGGTSTSVGSHLWGLGRRLAHLRRAVEAQELSAKFDKLAQQSLIQQRKRLLGQLGTQPDGRLNRRLGQSAFDEAKREYKALVRMKVPVSAARRQLEQVFRLSSKEVNRATLMIHWPDPLLASEHFELIQDFESKIQLNKDAAVVPADELIQSIEQLSLQLGNRAVAGDITAVEYAKAKRFLSGLVHEINATSSMN